MKMESPVGGPETTAIRASDQAVSIFAVVVLYKMRPEESATIKSLRAAIAAARTGTALRLEVLVADNTPGGQEPGELSAEVKYTSFPGNPGLATPYNIALASAWAEGFDWLLTLDQDTDLPSHYLTELARYARQYAADAAIAAIVPRIEDAGVPISPLRFAGGFMPIVAGPLDKGVLGRHATALNSASLLRVAALWKVGGYDERFPLNNSDTAMFHRLDRAGYRTVLAGEVVVRHELAIMRRKERMTLDRYKRLLEDERDFWDLHMGPLGRMERLLRLMGRAAKGFITGEDADFRRLTIAEIRRRVGSRRSVRLKSMRAGTASQDGLLPALDGHAGRREQERNAVR